MKCAPVGVARTSVRAAPREVSAEMTNHGGDVTGARLHVRYSRPMIAVIRVTEAEIAAWRRDVKRPRQRASAGALPEQRVPAPSSAAVFGKSVPEGVRAKQRRRP